MPLSDRIREAVSRLSALPKGDSEDPGIAIDAMIHAVLREDPDDEFEELVRHALTSSPVMSLEQIAQGIINLHRWREEQI
jgi:transcriptional regulator with XRE-family HTH domain